MLGLYDHVGLRMPQLRELAVKLGIVLTDCHGAQRGERLYWAIRPERPA